MNNNIVSEISIVPIKPKNGMVAFVSFVLFEQLYVNSVAVYTRFGGGIRLVYPRKKNLDICHPISHEFGELVESAVLMEILKYELFSVN
jgi:DNA-binding cell septation regulator SpoVG